MQTAMNILNKYFSLFQKRRPPSFFANLRDTLHVLMKYFRDADNLPKAVGDIQVIEHIEKTLKLHALETAELIHHYHLYRLEEQCKLDETKYGQLTVRCSFKGNNLEVIKTLIVYGFTMY